VIRVGGEPEAVAETPPTPLPSTSISSLDPTPAASASSPMLPPAQDVLVLGDSLALSTYAWFADLLPDRYVSWEAQVGRATPATADALSALDAAGRVPPVIVVSSGTNDPDSGSLRTAARRILDLAGPDRCVVWADVVRPDDFGDGMAAANTALEAAWKGHPNVIPVRWTRMVATHPDWLTADGIHPVQDGNIARARALADAVLSCSPLDPDAPVASKQYLPQASFYAPGGGSVPGVGSGTGTSSTPKAVGSSAPAGPTTPPAATPSQPSPSVRTSEPPASPPPADASQTSSEPATSSSPGPSGAGSLR
jgi:hypothetical protein